MISAMMSNGLLILLTLLSVGASGRPALMLSLGGALMISVTAGYARGGEGRMLKIAQFFLAVLFAFTAGGDFGCLVFVCLLWGKTGQQMLMADGMLVIRFLRLTSFTGFGYLLALFLVRLIMIDAVFLMMGLVRYALQENARRKEEEKRRLQNFHLSEMYEIRRNKELAMQSFYAEKNARLTERENISRSIHNSVGHSITAAIMTLDAADMLFDKKPEEAHRKMNDAAQRIRGSLGAIRSAVRALDEEAEDISVKDLICYVDNVLDDFLMDTERSCERHYEIYDPEMILPREHAEFLTGALEELLTNSVKHGGAMHFAVRLSGDNAHVRLDVKDDGKSTFDENTRDELIRKGFGLKKLASYADKCGGRTDFRNEGGFAAMIELPIG